jgi:C1A family cysteine protease
MARHAYGYRHDRYDDRDFRFSRLHGFTTATLPPSIDWTAEGPPILDQLQLGACTAFGIKRATQLAHTLRANTIAPRSELSLYYKERVLEHTITQDAGAMPRDGLLVTLREGIDTEANWPYDPAKFAVAPPRLTAEAAAAKISGFYRCHGLYEMKQALAARYPIGIGFDVYDSFESDATAQTGLIPIPNLDVEHLLGGHFVGLEGYRDADGVFLAANSWGTAWGDRGFCRFPYRFFDPQLGLVSDIWAVVV